MYIAQFQKVKSLFGYLDYKKVILALTLLSSCTNRQGVHNIIADMQGKEIVFVDDLQVWNPKTQSAEPIQHHMLQGNKIVIYFSRNMCARCNMDLMKRWECLAKEWPQVSFVFVLSYHSQDEDEILEQLYYLIIHGIILLDKHNSFFKANPMITRNPLLNIFMLNDSNHIELVGDPLYNEQMLELYRTCVNR